MLRGIIFVIFCLISGIQIASAQLYHIGERLDYRVAYKAQMVPNTEMAEVSVTTTADTLAGRTVYRTTGHARIMPEFRWFFDIDDRYDILVDTLTGRTLRFESNLKEGSYRFRSHYDYDWDAMRVATWAKSRDKEPRTRTQPLTPRSMDPVSLYFNLRTIDPDTLQQGRSYGLEMVLEDTVRLLKFRYIGREVCRVPKRGKFKALKFACTLGSSEEFSFTDGTEFFIWISDDKNLFPLLIESPVRIGSVRAYISSYRGLKYPLGCKVK